MPESGIYSIRNTSNEKVYIGSALNILDRWNLHRRSLCAGKHHSKKLQRAWDKYGDGSFVFEKLLLCSSTNLLFFEQRAIDTFDAANSGYNILRIAGSSLGHRASEETRTKLSISHKGKSPSEETRAKLSAAGIGNKRGVGRVPSAEHRAIISMVHTGKIVSEETRMRLSASLKGKRVSDESRAKMSATRKGVKPTLAARVKMSESATKAWARRKSASAISVII